jgi:hypothetical protein
VRMSRRIARDRHVTAQRVVYKGLRSRIRRITLREARRFNARPNDSPMMDSGGLSRCAKGVSPGMEGPWIYH